MPIVQHPVARHIAASMHAQEQRHDDQAGGPVIVDLDEAIFGLNAMAREAVGIVQSGIGQAAAHWQAEAVSMGTDPMAWLSASAYEGSWSAIASTIAVSAVSLPFAALAIKGGIDEIRHGRAERQRLKLEQQHLMARHARALEEGVVDGAEATAAPPGDSPCGPPGLERALAHKDTARLARTHGELRAANAQISTGAAAASSGTLMSANGLWQIVLQPVLKCCSKGMSVAAWIAQHAAWSVIVSVLGTIATMVFAPLAAVSATWLGSSFVHRSRVRCREFLRARGLLAESMADNAGAGVGAVGNTAYGRFLTAKLGKRAAFMLKFRDWSIGFLSGASTYTAGVLVKTALVGGALLGLGLLASHPLILVVLTVAITLGAVVMAGGSVNFIVNLGRIKRHESYESIEHPQLDRELFQSLDLLTQSEAGDTLPLPQRAGFRQRAYVYDQMVRQEKEVQKLVEQVATTCNKRYVWTDRSGGASYREHRATPASRRIGRDVVAAIGSAGVLMAGLMSGKGLGRSRAAAAEYYAGRRSALTARMLARVLAAMDPIALHAHLSAISQAQSKLLEARLVSRTPVIECSDDPARPMRGDDTLAWIGQQSARHGSDLMLMADLQSFQDAPSAKAVATAAEQSNEASEQASEHSGQDAADAEPRPISVGRWFIPQFLDLQHRVGLCTRFTSESKRPDADTQYAELAHYLLSQATEGLATLRGSLLACELDAARATAMSQAADSAAAQ